MTAENFVVVVRGDIRSRHEHAWDAEREAARLRSFGFPAYALDEAAKRAAKRALRTTTLPTCTRAP